MNKRGRLHVFESLDPKKTALAVIDMQVSFVGEGQPMETPMAREIVPNINRLAKAVREMGGKVCWVQLRSGDPSGESLWPIYHKYFFTEAKAKSHQENLTPGHPGHEIYPELDTMGSSCGALFPTGNVSDTIEGVPVTLIDNGMPIVLMAAGDFGKSGYESKPELDQDMELKQRLERIRLKAGAMMNLGNVADKTVPKMTLVAPPVAGGLITSRTFIPHVLHSSIGVLGAVSVATACIYPGSVANKLADIPKGNPKLCSIEHPSGEFTVEIQLDPTADKTQPVISAASVLRTARLLFDGSVFIPASVWDGASP